MRQTLLHRALPALLTLTLLADPAAAQSFAGTFADRGMVLTLHDARGRYNGTLVYDGGFYAVDAEEIAGELHGSFATDKGSFGFRAYFSGEILEFESNTITYSLRRTGKAGRPGPAEETPTAEVPTAADPEEPSAVAGAEVEEPSAPVAAEAPAVRPTPPTPLTPPAPPSTAEGVDEDDGQRDALLAGVWTRGTIDADAGARLPGVTALELDAGGSYATRGGAAKRTGRWRTLGRDLQVRPSGQGDWQTYCRYRVVVSTLLCSFEDGSRQLWFRR